MNPVFESSELTELLTQFWGASAETSRKAQMKRDSMKQSLSFSLIWHLREGLCSLLYCRPEIINQIGLGISVAQSRSGNIDWSCKRGLIRGISMLLLRLIYSYLLLMWFMSWECWGLPWIHKASNCVSPTAKINEYWSWMCNVWRIQILIPRS